MRPPRNRDIAEQVPRKDNSAADAAANWALDHNSFMEVSTTQTAAFIAELSLTADDNLGLLFSFDGAARGNPGPASSGVCAWWGLFDKDGFHARGPLIQKGCRLGTGTNNLAEAPGQATALKMCLHYHFWMIEQISPRSWA